MIAGLSHTAMTGQNFNFCLHSNVTLKQSQQCRPSIRWEAVSSAILRSIDTKLGPQNDPRTNAKFSYIVTYRTRDLQNVLFWTWLAQPMVCALSGAICLSNQWQMGKPVCKESLFLPFRLATPVLQKLHTSPWSPDLNYAAFLNEAPW